RLGPGLQAELVGPAKVEDLLDDMALLVDLDGVDAAVATLEVIVLDGLLEGVVNFADAVAGDVGEAQQNGQLNATGLELVDQLLEVNGLFGTLAGLDGDVPGLVDGEVSLSPVADAVSLDGVLNLPFIHQLRLSAFGHLSRSPWGRAERVRNTNREWKARAA